MRNLVLALAVLVGGCEGSPYVNCIERQGVLRDRIDRLAADSARCEWLEFTNELCDSAYDLMGARVDSLMADSARHVCKQSREINFYDSDDTLTISAPIQIRNMSPYCDSLMMWRKNKDGDWYLFPIYGHNHDSCTQSQEGRR